MLKRMTIFLAVALLLISGMALAQEPEPTKEEVLMLRILELVKERDEAMKNQLTKKAFLLGKQIERAEAEHDSFLAKRDAIDNFKGVDWGIGYAMMYSNKIFIEEAEVVNGIVRVKREGNIRPKILAEIHQYFVLDDKSNGQWGIGPFVGLITDSNEFLDALAIGLMVGFRRLGEESSRSLNLGIGYVWDRNCKMLGDGFYPNMPPPEGESDIRFKYETYGGIIFVVSITFW